MLVHLCFVSRATGFVKVSNSKSDLQGHSRALKVKIKVKVGFFYATTSRAVQSQEVQEVAVDWQDPMVRERNAAATTHSTAPINHIRPSPHKHSPDGAVRARNQTSDYSSTAYYSIYRPRKDERLSRPG